MSEYWQNVFSESDFIYSQNLQSQVGRTHLKEPIDDEIWKKTVDFVLEKMNLHEQCDMLDLCAGNGLFSIPLAKKLSHGTVTVVDFSEPLLTKLKECLKNDDIDNIKIIQSDINKLQFPANSYSVIMIYAALQYFNEKETLLLFEKSNKWLKPGGVFYVGDIPDRSRLWSFVNTKHYEDIFFDNLKSDTPAIGNWYEKDYLVKMARYAGFSKAEVLCQPDWQINSHFKFDLILYA